MNPLFTEDPISLKNLLIGIPIWLIGGLIYGYLMKSIMSKKEDA